MRLALAVAALLASDGGVSVEAICAADQADRLMENGRPVRPWPEVQARDAQRRLEIRAAERSGSLRSPDELACAALVFQHGERLEDFEAARAFALAALALDPGHARARRLVALSTDRALMWQGRPQKYGTQSFRNDAGVFQRWPIDPSTTDAERVALGLEPLVQERSAAVDGGVPKR